MVQWRQNPRILKLFFEKKMTFDKMTTHIIGWNPLLNHKYCGSPVGIGLLVMWWLKVKGLNPILCTLFLYISLFFFATRLTCLKKLNKASVLGFLVGLSAIFKTMIVCIYVQFSLAR